MILNKLLRAAAWGICYLLPVKKNKLMISSYYGRGYGDNPKYIVKELLSRTDKLHIIWAVKNESEKATLPKDVDSCIYGSFKHIYHLATSKIWIDNCRRAFRYKKKSQRYMQTWHGFALKRIEADVSDKLEPGYIKDAKHDSANIDIIISDSSFMTGIYSNSFWYDGETVEWGSPRNDCIINTDDKTVNRVKEYFGLSEGTKTVLYAPTFRSNGSIEPYSVDYERVIKACKEKFGGAFAVLVRLHPNVVDKCKDIEFNEHIINATLYPDMQELMAFADIVITDYSSLMFDFSLMHKPCFRFATDIEEYRGDRNFYFDLTSLPFPLCTDNDSLEEAIDSFDAASYRQRLDEFFDSVGMVRDGNASVRCADWILKQISDNRS